MNTSTGMRSNSAYDDFDRDAERNSEAQVVNVSPYTARFEIAGSPGSPARRYKLEPGASMHIQAGYAVDFLGAGRQPVRATIESLTEFAVRPGRTLPMVVARSKAEQVRKLWAEELAKAAQAPAPVLVSLPAVGGGDAVEMLVQPTPVPPPVATPVDPDEDQDGGPIDEPPPDHDDPIEIPAPKGKGRKV